MTYQLDGVNAVSICLFFAQGESIPDGEGEITPKHIRINTLLAELRAAKLKTHGRWDLPMGGVKFTFRPSVFDSNAAQLARENEFEMLCSDYLWKCSGAKVHANGYLRLYFKSARFISEQEVATGT